MNCPICNKEITLRTMYCEHCGFEFHILPEDVCDAVRAYEQERIEKYKERMQLMSEAENKANELTDQLLAATNRADAAEKTVAERTKEIQEIQKEKNELREQINASNVEKPLAFLVMMQGDSISALFGIYEGENSFGYMKSHDRHQQIICNAHVADNHFVIKATVSTDSKGRPRTKFFVTPKDGQIYHSSEHANLISSEVELEKNECVYIDNVKFTLVAKKK